MLWLRERDVDIRCIRLRPYRVPGGQLLLDVQPIIPLPETEDFLVRLEERSAAERQRGLGERKELAGRFLTALVRRAHELGYTGHERCTPSPKLAHWSRSFARSGLALQFVTSRTESRVELLLQGEKARERLASLQGRREEIERRFGGPLLWGGREGVLQCRVWCAIPGGYRSPEAEWPDIQSQMIDAMQRLEAALRPEIDRLP